MNTMNDDTGVNVDVNSLHDDTLGNTEVKMRTNSANDLRLHINTQSDRSNE